MEEETKSPLTSKIGTAVVTGAVAGTTGLVFKVIGETWGVPVAFGNWIGGYLKIHLVSAEQARDLGLVVAAVILWGALFFFFRPRKLGLRIPLLNRALSGKVALKTTDGKTIHVDPKYAPRPEPDRMFQMAPYSARPSTPQADVNLREGFGYILSGRWGLDFTEADLSHLHEIESLWNSIRQKAYDDEIQIWGRDDELGQLLVDIEPQFWANHEIVYPRLKDSRVETRMIGAGPFRADYHDLYLNKAQIAQAYPDAGR